MRILGVDPGSTATGWGLVDREGSRVSYVAHGVLRPARGAPLCERLACIHEGMTRVAREHSATIAVVEKVFVATNPHSALVLGHARGAALASLAASGLDVHEVAARAVKQAVVGNGGASKQQVQRMVVRLLDLDAEPPVDAADALAVAICHAHAGPLAGLGVRRRRGRGRRAASLDEWTGGSR